MPADEHSIEDLQGSRASDGSRGMSIVQRGNLRALESTLRRQWRLGQSIVLCWSLDENGLLVIFVPHYFLGNFCAPVPGQDYDVQENEAFIRELISGERRKSDEELFQICERLDVSPTFIKLDTHLSDEPAVLDGVEQLIKRYGLSFVENRAVLLFDIVGFSLCTPFEQASQLNSLSYSMNSAYNKLLSRGIEINFARTTTGDGYYIWNRDLGPDASRNLFFFMLLVIADNALAREVSRGNTVPVIRSGYHVGSHYELFQAEGVNPTVFSYIVGEVTIELARMLDKAQDSQILIGDFSLDDASGQEGLRDSWEQNSAAFVAACNRDLTLLSGVQLGGRSVSAASCYLTAEAGDELTPLSISIVDKHGLSRSAFNLQIEIERGEHALHLGLQADSLQAASMDESGSVAQSVVEPEQQQATPASSTEELIDELATLLQEHPPRIGAGD